MSLPVEIERPYFEPVELLGTEHKFWPNVIDVLQTHDTRTLYDRVVAVANQAPNVDLVAVHEMIDVISLEYGDKPPRKLTGDNEINHSLQVFLVGAELIGPDSLTTQQAQIMLGHNLVEDTTLPRQVRKNMGTVVHDGIDALSHHVAGVARFPNGDKTPHFNEIINAHDDPEHDKSELVTIKIADFIVVGNDPLTPSELVDSTRIPQWQSMTDKKIREMKLFKSLLPQEQTGAHRRLREAIAFTTLRQDPQAQTKLTEVLQRRTAQELPRQVPTK